jgi:hypothetical protein
MTKQRLTEKQRDAMVDEWRSGVVTAVVAKKYGVTEQTVLLANRKMNASNLHAQRLRAQLDEKARVISKLCDELRLRDDTIAQLRKPTCFACLLTHIVHGHSDPSANDSSTT